MTDAGRPIRVAAIQQGGRSDDPRRNLDDLLASIDEAAAGGVDYVVATELSLTPYFCTVHDPVHLAWAETVPGPATNAVAAMARRYGATIIFPLYHRAEDGKYYNSAVVIGPDGRIIPGVLPDGSAMPYFSKVHLPQIDSDTLVTDERYYFAAGDGFPIFQTRDARIGVLICYDRRFPEAWRALALGGAEIVFMPGCIPAWDPAAAASSGEMFVAELRTRACENLLYVVACNRAGYERLHGRETLFFGESCVIGPGGTVLAHGLANAPCIVRAELDLGEVARARARLPLLGDRRPGLYAAVCRPMPRAEK